MASAPRSIGMVVSAFTASLSAGTTLSPSGLIALPLLVVGIAVVALTVFFPEVVTLLGISAFYLNLPGIAVIVHGLPLVVAGSAFILLLGPFLVRLLLRRESVVVDRPLLLIVAFLGAVLLSFFAVKDEAAATRWLTTFLTEGLLLYFLALNLFRTTESLRRALDVLMLCGALLGGLTLYQEVSRSYAQQFSGLAQRNIEYGAGEGDWREEKNLFREPEKIHLAERAAGPIGDPNRYAQILILLLPLVYFRLRSEGKPRIKLVCAVCGALILAGALLTYSRGGFVALIILLALLKWMGGIRLKEVGLFAGLLVIAVLAWAPGYVLRIQTMGGAVTGLSQETQGEQTDGAIRGRLTEMLASFNVFLDHPLIGVGPGQFAPVYSQSYMDNPDIAFRRSTTKRRAHNLYLELAAETGLLGTVSFLGVVGVIQSRLWRAWRRWRGRRQDLAGLAAGFFLGIWAYLVTGIFLHLSYQRYYWLFLGMAGAALQILTDEDSRSAHG